MGEIHGDILGTNEEISKWIPAAISGAIPTWIIGCNNARISCGILARFSEWIPNAILGHIPVEIVNAAISEQISEKITG